MRTIEVKLYSFDELSEEAKEKAISYFRDSESSDPYFIQDANKTFERFADIFSIHWRNIEYREPYRNEYDIKLNDDILHLTGQRLATYIWNNYKRDLFKGKYYSLWSKKDVSFKHHKNGHPVLKTRYSKIFLSNSCVLTGVCYDEDILTPIYEFLDNPLDIDFETLLNDCIYSLCHSVESEIEYRLSDEAIIETIQDNEYEFTEDGELA